MSGARYGFRWMPVSDIERARLIRLLCGGARGGSFPSHLLGTFVSARVQGCNPCESEQAERAGDRDLKGKSRRDRSDSVARRSPAP